VVEEEEEVELRCRFASVLISGSLWAAIPIRFQ
jgi:hypothetical protein